MWDEVYEHDWLEAMVPPLDVYYQDLEETKDSSCPSAPRLQVLRRFRARYDAKDVVSEASYVFLDEDSMSVASWSFV